MIMVLKWVNVGLRGLMEAGLVAALAYWGYAAGHSQTMKWILCIGAPVVVFGVWGYFDFRNVVRHPEPFRLALELILTGLAVYALYIAGAGGLGMALALLSIVHHVLVYVLGETLLKNG